MAILAELKQTSGGNLRKIKNTSWSNASTMVVAGEEMVFAQNVELLYIDPNRVGTVVYQISTGSYSYGVGGTSLSSMMNYLASLDVVPDSINQTDIIYLT